MSTHEEEDLSCLLSEDDLLSDSSTTAPNTELDFVDYYDENQESTKSNDDNDDPFNIDDLLSESEPGSENGIGIDNNQQADEHIADNNKSTPMEEDNEAELDEIDWDELHPWPQPDDDDEPFAARVINIEKITVLMNEQRLLQTLFHDIPSHCHPSDIRLYHHRYDLSEKNTCRWGHGQLIFESEEIVE